MTRKEQLDWLYRLKSELYVYPKEWLIPMNNALDTAIKALEQYPSWIPVSERLPRFNDIVLASTESDYDNLKVILTVYEAEEYWFDGRVKAWMPRPKEYKPESEE